MFFAIRYARIVNTGKNHGNSSPPSREPFDSRTHPTMRWADSSRSRSPRVVHLCKLSRSINNSNASFFPLRWVLISWVNRSWKMLWLGRRCQLSSWPVTKIRRNFLSVMSENKPTRHCTDPSGCRMVLMVCHCA